MSSCKLKRHVRQDCSDPERSKGTERMRKRTWEIRKRLIALGVLDDREADADESQRKGARDGARHRALPRACGAVYCYNDIILFHDLLFT